MGMLKIVAAGALSYLGYKAWRKHQDDKAVAPKLLEDHSARIAPHGDPLAADVAQDATTTVAPRDGAQSSPGFGAI